MHYPVQVVYDQGFEDDQRLHDLVTMADSLLVFGNHLLQHLNNFITTVAPLRAPAVTYIVPCNVCGFHPVTTAAIEAPSAPAILTWVETPTTSPALSPAYSHGALMANPPIAQPRLPQASEQKARRKQPPSISSAAIDPLPRGPRGWRVAVSQWDEKLKNWKQYRGELRLVSTTKRKTREIIAKEYDAYGRDDNKFLADYPEANLGVTKLVNAIRRRHGQQRRSSDGTPVLVKQEQQEA